MKQEIIEEMAKVLEGDCGECYTCKYFEHKGTNCTYLLGAEYLYNAGYRKIPEGAVVIEKTEYDKLRLLADECLDWRRKNCNVGELPKENAVAIPKEISCYENIEKRVRTFRIDGNNVDFTDEQIMAITSIFNYKEMQAEEIRKETAEKFAERLKARFHKSREYYEVDTGTAWSNGCIGGLINNTIDEIAKEITER